MLPLPLFIVAGAPKCGTTALWNHLNLHPQICMADIKEPRFFSDADGWLGRGQMSSGHLRSGNLGRGAVWFRGLFRIQDGHKILGEASTQYFSVENTVPLIRGRFPGTKVILMLRNPVDRTYSHYWEECRLGIPLPDFSVLLQTNHCRLEYYRKVSDYRRNICRFIQGIPSDQLKVILIDDLRKDPAGVLRDVFSFLEVSDDFHPEDLSREYNLQTVSRWDSLQYLISKTKEMSLVKRMPKSMKSFLKRGISRVEAANAIPFQAPPLGEEERHQLIGEFLPQVEFVETLLCRDLSSWKG